MKCDKYIDQNWILFIGANTTLIYFFIYHACWCNVFVQLHLFIFFAGIAREYSLDLLIKVFIIACDFENYLRAYSFENT
jgi:hypothetical protein